MNRLLVKPEVEPYFFLFNLQYVFLLELANQPKWSRD
jgi:hypothetical protein